MNGDNNDNSYRYTMPEFNIYVAGKGNGIHTIFNNINDISKSINHPSNIIMSYIAAITGSNYISEKNTLTGPHNISDLTDILLEYIKYLVMCPICSIPETIPILNGKKKNIYLSLSCSACKNNTKIEFINKRINKGIDIISKYLKTNEWIISKGIIVKQITLSKQITYKQNNELNDEFDELNNKFDELNETLFNLCL